MSEREGQFTEAVSQREVMQSLLEHPGWKMILANLDARIEERTRQLEEPLESQEKVFLHEYMKGARAMARSIKALPEAIATQASEAIKAIEKESEQEDGGTDSEDEWEGSDESSSDWADD